MLNEIEVASLRSHLMGEPELAIQSGTRSADAAPFHISEDICDWTMCDVEAVVPLNQSGADEPVTKSFLSYPRRANHKDS
jgi:hypothetical protein